MIKNLVGASVEILIRYNHDRFEYVDHEVREYCLSICLQKNIYGWNQLITTIYGPNDCYKGRELWEELRRIRRHWTILWIVGGDFNIVRYTNEHLERGKNNRER